MDPISDNDNSSNSSPPPPPASSTDSSAGSTSEFAATLPVDLPDPQVIGAAAAASESDPEDTARIGAAAADELCSMMWGMPLEASEKAALERDLYRVLKKHDVPNLPFEEEVGLGLTAFGIVRRRVVAKRARARGESDGGAVPGEEGVVEVGLGSEVGLSPTGAPTTVSHLLP